MKHYTYMHTLHTSTFTSTALTSIYALCTQYTHNMNNVTPFFLRVGVSNPIKPDGSDMQTKNVLDKINGMFEYAKSESWIAGINPWHFHNRGGNQAPGCPCDMRSGTESMPVVVDRLREIGSYIIGNKTEAAPATVQAAAPVLVAETQAEILWYPLNSHTLYDGDVAAIFVRAQTSPDVDLVTTDAGFVSYDNGTTWAVSQPSSPVSSSLKLSFLTKAYL